MSKYFRTSLILVLTALVAGANSTSAFADKKNNNNSNSDEKKDKDKDDDQNNQKNSGQKKYNYQKSNNQQLQNGFQSNGKQGKFSGQQFSSSQSNIQFKNSQQGQNFQKQQWQNGQKQSDPSNLQKFNGPNNWTSQSHHDHKEVHNFVVKFGGPEPFSDKWYKDHPHAWHHDHHGNDAWKVVTAVGVVGFLGWEAYHPHTVVVYEPVPYDTLFVSRPGVIIDPARGEWMPLGVYSLMLGPADSSTRMLDLAVDRFGHIRGSYYDMVTGASHNVAGIIDARTQYAQWSLESNRQLTFYTPLGEMMQPQGAVNVSLPSGERQQWQLVRMEGGGY